jgi:hypothetical protein
MGEFLLEEKKQTMRLHDLTMKSGWCLGLVAFCCGAGAAAGQSAPAMTAQSLAGDWEYVVSPPLKLVLHLRVDAGGALSGTVDTPDNPPKHIDLSNVRLAGKVLTYSMPPQPGTFTEVVSDDGKKMLGPYMWVKVGAAEPAAPPFVPLAQLAGDWETPGGGPAAQILRLRVNANGSLTGAIDTPEPNPQRIELSKVQVSGRTLSYTMPDGVHTYQGAFSNDGKTVAATGASTIDASWQHVRTAAQAATHDLAEGTKPSNGDWSGVAHNVTALTLVKPENDTVHLTFHFRINPDSCTLDSPEQGGAAGTPCTVTLTGNKVHVDSARIMAATFDGTLSADGTHLNGTWKVGGAWQWGPMEMEMARTGPPR